MKKLLKAVLLVLSMMVLHPDAYAQWTALNSGTTDGLTAISVCAPDTAYAVSTDFANGGKILATKDGNSWIQQYSSPVYLLCVFFRSSLLGWAGGGIIPNGLVLKTTDGGQTWTTASTNLHQVYSLFFINDTLGWAIGNNAIQGQCFIYQTTDGGFTWTQQYTGTDYLRSIHFSSPATGYAAGDNGRIFKTVNGGLNWFLLSTGVVFHFNDIDFVSDSIGWAAGAYVNGGCYHTINGGSSWTSQALPATTPVSSVSFISPSRGWLAGNNGSIYYTANGGQNWTLQSSTVSGHLRSIKMYDHYNGYAVGQTGTIVKYESSGTGLVETKQEAMYVYPNPAENFIRLAPWSPGSDLEYAITDQTGRELVRGTVSGTDPVLKVSSLPPGMYLLRLGNPVVRVLRFVRSPE
ncbi:MAG: T9SS type A sorting domain-containing protein [Bacteroidia bacterium]|nr:T9SS type A sorting domain-containing protein [Bacteroidia bacterium]